MATSTSVTTMASRAPKEPTLEDVYKKIFEDKYIIPAYYLLDPSLKFINEKRIQFTETARTLMPIFTEVLLNELNFLSAPADVVEHFLYPDAPVAILVGGQAMNLFEGIRVPSTDLDIDLIPLVNRGSSTSASSSSSASSTSTNISILPIYTADHKLQPLYQKYFDWIVERVIEIIERRKSMSNSRFLNATFEEMTKTNIDTNIEVKLSKQFDRKLGYVPGEVLQVKTIGLRKYVVAEIINESFFSKIAIWIRQNDDIERIVEFKLLTKLPTLSDYISIDKDRVFARPTAKKFIENGIETLGYRIAGLQRDVGIYTRTIKQLMILPEPSILQFEETIRKKLLLSAMRINDLFDRLIELFNKLQLSQESLQLFLRFLMVLLEKKENLMNPTLQYELMKIQPSFFPNLAGNVIFMQMLNWFDKERSSVYEMFRSEVKNVDLMVDEMSEMNKGIFLKTLEENYPLFMLFSKKNPQERRLKILKEEKDLEAAVLSSLNTTTTITTTGTSAATPLIEGAAAKVNESKVLSVINTGNDENRSVSPTFTDNSEKINLKNVSENTQRDQEREAEEVFAIFNSKEKNTKIFEKVNSIRQRQKDEKAEKEKKRKEVEREAKYEKQQKKLALQQALREEQAKKNAEGNALLKNLEEKRKEYVKKLQEQRFIFFYCESPSYNPQNFLDNVYETFMPSMFFNQSNHKYTEKIQLIAYKFPEYAKVLDRKTLFTPEEYSALPAEDQAEEPEETELKIYNEIFEITIMQQINEFIISVLLFTFVDMDSETIIKNYTNTSELLLTLSEKKYINYMKEKMYAQAYIDKLYTDVINRIRSVKQEISQLKGEIQAIAILIQTGKSGKKEVLKIRNSIDELTNQCYKNLLNICVIFQEFVFNIIVACGGSNLPDIPTKKDFLKVYEPILQLNLGLQSKRRLLNEGYHVNIFKFTSRVVTYHSMCRIDQLNNLKNTNVAKMKVDANPPLLVLTSMPTPFKNPIGEYKSTDKDIKDYKYEVFENIYNTMKEYNFTFFEDYPLFKTYIKMYPEFSVPFLELLNQEIEVEKDKGGEKIKIQKYSPMKKMKIRQALEITLEVSSPFWNEIYTNYGGEKKDIFFKRFSIFIMTFMDRNYVLNSRSNWFKIYEYVLDVKKYSITDIAQIAALMATKLVRFYLVRFLALPSILNSFDRVMRNLPYSRAIERITKDLYSEIEQLMRKNEATTTSSSANTTENKKGGSRYKKTQKYRKHYRKTRKH